GEKRVGPPEGGGGGGGGGGTAPPRAALRGARKVERGALPAPPLGGGQSARHLPARAGGTPAGRSRRARRRRPPRADRSGGSCATRCGFSSARCSSDCASRRSTSPMTSPKA